MKAMGLTLVVGCLAVLAACSSPRGCSTHPCNGPEPPPTTVHLSLGGQTFLLAPGRSHPINIRSGRPLPITITISSPSGATVKDVYLTVNSYPSGIASGVPTGKVKILNHHAGRLEPNQSISATWIPQSLFGTNRLDLSLDYSVGEAGVGTIIANMTLTT
jgi:hypothetical protein